MVSSSLASFMTCVIAAVVDGLIAVVGELSQLLVTTFLHTLDSKSSQALVTVSSHTLVTKSSQVLVTKSSHALVTDRCSGSTRGA